MSQQTNTYDGEFAPGSSHLPTRVLNASPAKEIEYHPTWGGYNNLPPVPGFEGKHYWPRVSSLAKVLDDTRSLEDWKLRQVVWGLKGNPHLFDLIGPRVRPTSKEGKAALQAVADRALDLAGSHDGADRGTEIHDHAEILDRGHGIPDQVFRSMDPDLVRVLISYRDGLRARGITMLPEYMERVVINTTLGRAGRLDRMARIVDGRIVIGDLKSQKWEPGQYDSVALAIQLASYAYADFMLDPVTWTWEPMPDVDRTLGQIYWVPSTKPGHFEVYEVDLSQGWELAQLASLAYKARYMKGIVSKRV